MAVTPNVKSEFALCRFNFYKYHISVTWGKWGQLQILQSLIKCEIFSPLSVINYSSFSTARGHDLAHYYSSDSRIQRCVELERWTWWEGVKNKQESHSCITQARTHGDLWTRLSTDASVWLIDFWILMLELPTIFYLHHRAGRFPFWWYC